METISSSRNDVDPSTDAHGNQPDRTGEKRRCFQRCRADPVRRRHPPFPARALPPRACSCVASKSLLPPRTYSCTLLCCPQTLAIGPKLEIQFIRPQSQLCVAPVRRESQPTVSASTKSSSPPSTAAAGKPSPPLRPAPWRKDESTVAAFFELQTRQGRARHGCYCHPHYLIYFCHRYFRCPY
jgi:hypothetical protein